MAIYEYKCKKCDKIFEKNYNLGKAPKIDNCPICGKKCNRFFSPPMIQFIGSGFYVNDSKATQGKDKH